MVEALQQGRFYVFNGEHWRDFISRSIDPVLKAENPPVLTWGPDLRPKD